jgi:hypothetical protein
MCSFISVMKWYCNECLIIFQKIFPPYLPLLLPLSIIQPILSYIQTDTYISFSVCPYFFISVVFSVWCVAVLLYEALCFKPQGSRFHSQWDHWTFLLNLFYEHTVALRSTQYLTGMTTRKLPGCKGLLADACEWQFQRITNLRSPWPAIQIPLTLSLLHDHLSLHFYASQNFVCWCPVIYI